VEWGSFITGGITILFTYLLFTTDKENEEVLEGDEEQESEIVVNDFSGKHVTLSCQTCRKLKKHKEVKPNLYQCVKCKRNVDLRAS
jgi:acetyl-CoA carboxylase beta subunit